MTENYDYTGHTPAKPAKTAHCVSITSFGYLHGSQPTADFIVDLRDHFRDPRIDPRLRYMTARDQEVVDKVMGTEGVAEFVEEYAAVLARVARRADVTAALGCAGGRHRAPVICEAVARVLANWGYRVEVEHRDLEKPVVERGARNV